jgi:hypothetical protein
MQKEREEPHQAIVVSSNVHSKATGRGAARSLTQGRRCNGAAPARCVQASEPHSHICRPQHGNQSRLGYTLSCEYHPVLMEKFQPKTPPPQSISFPAPSAKTETCHGVRHASAPVYLLHLASSTDNALLTELL